MLKPDRNWCALLPEILELTLRVHPCKKLIVLRPFNEKLIIYFRGKFHELALLRHNPRVQLIEQPFQCFEQFDHLLRLRVVG